MHVLYISSLLDWHYLKIMFCVVQGNDLMRILNIAAFAVSSYASTEGRQCKPFNPLLGETYEADYPDKGLRFFSEKVTGISLLTFQSRFVRMRRTSLCFNVAFCHLI